jgi:hypothetical protein
MTSTPLVSDRSDPSVSYQQALCDFGITELIEVLTNFCDPDFDVARMHLEEQELEHPGHHPPHPTTLCQS